MVWHDHPTHSLLSCPTSIRRKQRPPLPAGPCNIMVLSSLANARATANAWPEGGSTESAWRVGVANGAKAHMRHSQVNVLADALMAESGNNLPTHARSTRFN
jgi:hypothetical protein